MFLVFYRTAQFTLPYLYTVFHCMVCVYEFFKGSLFVNVALSSKCSQEIRCRRLIWDERKHYISSLQLILEANKLR